MEFLFRDRGHGKRQVKVSQDVALLEDQVSLRATLTIQLKIFLWKNTLCLCTLHIQNSSQFWNLFNRAKQEMILSKFIFEASKQFSSNCIDWWRPVEG